MSDVPTGDPAAWGGWFSAATETDDDGSEEADEVTSPAPVVPVVDYAPAVDVGVAVAPPSGSSASEGPSPGAADRLRRLINWPGRWARSWRRPGRGDHAAGGSLHGADTPAATTRRWPRPDLVTYLLVSLLLVVGVLTVVLHEIRPNAKASAQSACTRGIASTGATVRAATLRAVQGSGGRWTVGVQATDGSGTRQWICHVLWDGSHATILTAVPGTQ